ncbi:MAG: class I SAM-dependent methyltransferase [Chloroflexi bacterium]|nr:class I SAM-dependent methyltransferase [Chloroflexota bacterium]
MADTNTPPICDYEQSPYRTAFWEGQGRDYEDQSERVALRRLLPPRGRRLLEVGAGFGRLTNEFDGYDQVILLDYSTSLLAEARQHLGTSDRYRYVAADIYRSPIADGCCDAATMIRVIHHMADAPAALQQVRAALAPGAAFVLEFANKRNVKAMLRYLLRRQDWSPYDLTPVEFVELNFDFHPRYIAHALEDTDFDTQRRLALSYLRVDLLKRIIPTRWLVAIDSILQWSGQIAPFSPSVFTQNIAAGSGPAGALDGPIFKCPACRSTALDIQDDRIRCQQCLNQYVIRDGIYDFKIPIA